MRKFLCYIFGHKWIVFSRIDYNPTGQLVTSQLGHAKCSRCGHEENYQYDIV